VRGRRTRPTRVALIGFGAIGGGLAELVAHDTKSSVEIVGALVRHVERNAPPPVPLVGSLEQLLDLAPDVVAEAAGHAALRRHGPTCLRASVPLVILSTGALADAEFESQLRNAAEAGRAHVSIASGAVGGLDLIASAAQGRITRSMHTIVKPPGSLGLRVTRPVRSFAAPPGGRRQSFRRTRMSQRLSRLRGLVWTEAR
jgi:aspartate dehydrogenase